MPAAPPAPVESGADTAYVKLVGLSMEATMKSPFKALSLFPVTTTVSCCQSPLGVVVLTVATPPDALAVVIENGIGGPFPIHFRIEPLKVAPSMRLPPK